MSGVRQSRTPLIINVGKSFSVKTMTVQSSTDQESSSKPQDEPILCPHCLRTASNGIKCQGICVSDSGY